MKKTKKKKKNLKKRLKKHIFAGIKTKKYLI